ncbi:MAG TPA: hypothetical protein PLW24_07655 [Burkholderiaceae bacterium]|nr:hypothetical protein [Burkholderiaceae bacterium]
MTKTKTEAVVITPKCVDCAHHRLSVPAIAEQKFREHLCGAPQVADLVTGSAPACRMVRYGRGPCGQAGELFRPNGLLNTRC